jgi:hypothetical protein
VKKKLDVCNCGEGKRASVIVQRESLKVVVVVKDERASVNVRRKSVTVVIVRGEKALR